jgi:hypothetical protein
MIRDRKGPAELSRGIANHISDYRACREPDRKAAISIACLGMSSRLSGELFIIGLRQCRDGRARKG